MATEFTTILAGPDTSATTVARRLEERLFAAGYRHDGGIVRAELDASRGVFDEVSDAVEIRVEKSFVELPPDVDAWSGFSVEFWRDDLMLYVITGRFGGATPHLTAWVDVSERQLRSLLKQRDEQRIGAAYAAVAAAIQATGGYGHPLLTFHPLSPSEAVAAITSMPEYPGEKASLGVVPVELASERDLASRFGEEFRAVRSTLGYSVLLRRDLETILGP